MSLQTLYLAAPLAKVATLLCSCIFIIACYHFTHTDLNECLEFNSVNGSGDLGPCRPDQTCVNTFGSFFCTCRPGFTEVDGGWKSAL